MRYQKSILFLLTFAFLFVFATASADTWYVYTQNGKTLNLRSEYTNEVIGHIPYGTALEPDMSRSTASQAYVTYKNISGYVKWSFLQRNQPVSRKQLAANQASTNMATAIPVVQPTPQIIYVNQPTTGIDANLFTNFFAKNYSAQTQGTAVMRWAPSDQAPIVKTYGSGVSLEVLMENNTWSQVYDEEGKLAGFILSSSLLPAGSSVVSNTSDVSVTGTSDINNTSTVPVAAPVSTPDPFGGATMVQPVSIPLENGQNDGDVG